MRDRDYYPAGAYNDPNAPYNDYEVPERDFDAEFIITAKRNVSITTNRYIPYVDEEDGHTYIEMCDDMDWKAWTELYNEQYWSLPELFKQVGELLNKWKPEKLSRSDKALYKRITDEISGWEEDDIELLDHE